MMPDWLPALAQSVFWIVSMALTTVWLARSRQRPLPASDPDRLRQPPAMLVVGIVGIVFCVGAMTAFTIWPDDSVTVWPYVFFGGFTLLPLYIVADYRNARHAVTEAGMEFGRPSGRRLAFRWDDVERIRYARSAGWFRIALHSGEVVRVSSMLMGLPVFADKVLRHVPAARIDPQARAMLEDAARGKLPSLWG